jgi:hypothetical protein
MLDYYKKENERLKKEIIKKNKKIKKLYLQNEDKYSFLVLAGLVSLLYYIYKNNII